MAFTDTIGAATIDGLAYVGGLARLTGGAAKAVFISPFQGKRFHISRAIHQAMAVGVEALPITSLISFFIGAILISGFLGEVVARVYSDPMNRLLRKSSGTRAAPLTPEAVKPAAPQSGTCSPPPQSLSVRLR